jgi:cysteinyl-tRNA synthetase
MTPKAIKLFDSYQKKIIKIDPEQTTVPNTLNIYSCGPTVYNFMTIGNLRAAFLPEMIKGVAQLTKWDTKWVSNITDVGHLVDDGDHGEDKLEKGAKREGKKVSEIVDFYTKDYIKQCNAIGIDLPSGLCQPKATEYIEEQMTLALELLQQNKAYLLEDGIYFDSRKNEEVFGGKDFTITEPLRAILITQAKQKAGQSNEFNDRDIKNTTKNPGDFALWKFVVEDSLQKWRFTDISKLQEKLHFWIDDSDNKDEIVERFQKDFSYTDKKGEEYYLEDPIDRIIKNLWLKLGKSWGCPGWHSECVAMICALNQDSLLIKGAGGIIDLHTGGEDHIDVHHKNEILQSEALGFHLSKYWVHNKFVLVDGKKMSKSLGNVFLATGKYEDTGFYSLTNPPSDIQEKFKVKSFDPLAYRLMLMEHHYNQQLDFTWEKLAQSQARLFNLRKLYARIESYRNSKNQPFDYESEEYDQKKLTLVEPLYDNLNIPEFLIKISTELDKLIVSVTNNHEVSILDLAIITGFDVDFLKLEIASSHQSDEIIALAEKRQEAKTNKDWEMADEIRKEIAQNGWQVDDYPWGFGLWSNPTLKI